MRKIAIYGKGGIGYKFQNTNVQFIQENGVQK